MPLLSECLLGVVAMADVNAYQRRMAMLADQNANPAAGMAHYAATPYKAASAYSVPADTNMDEISQFEPPVKQQMQPQQQQQFETGFTGVPFKVGAAGSSSVPPFDASLFRPKLVASFAAGSSPSSAASSSSVPPFDASLFRPKLVASFAAGSSPSSAASSSSSAAAPPAVDFLDLPYDQAEFPQKFRAFTGEELLQNLSALASGFYPARVDDVVPGGKRQAMENEKRGVKRPIAQTLPPTQLETPSAVSIMNASKEQAKVLFGKLHTAELEWQRWENFSEEVLSKNRELIERHRQESNAIGWYEQQLHNNKLQLEHQQEELKSYTKGQEHTLAENRRLQAQNDLLEANNFSGRTTLAELQIKLAEATSGKLLTDNQALSAAVAKYDRSHAAEQAALEDARNAKRDLDAMTRERDTLKTANEAGTAQYSVLYKKREATKAKLVNVNAEFATLKNTAASFNTAIKQKDDLIASNSAAYAASIASLQGQLTLMQSTGSAADAAKIALADANQKLTDQVAQLKTQISNYEAVEEIRKKTVNTSEQSANLATSAKTALEAQLLTANNQLKDLSAQYAVLRDAATSGVQIYIDQAIQQSKERAAIELDLRKQFAKAQLDHDNLVARLTSTHEALVAQKAADEDRWAKEKQRMEHAKLAQETLLKEKREQYNNAHTDLLNAQTAKTEAETKLNSEINKLQSRVDELTSQLTLATTQKEAAQLRSKTLSEQLTKLPEGQVSLKELVKSETAHYETQIVGLKKEIEEARTARLAANSASATAAQTHREELASLTDQVARTKASLESATNEKASLEAQVARL